jgi:adenosine deaminase
VRLLPGYGEVGGLCDTIRYHFKHSERRIGNLFVSTYQAPTHRHEFYRTLPKVELHRHLEGSIRLSTLLEIGRAHGMSLPGTGKLRELVQVGSEDIFSFENFLSKFQTLRMFYRSPEAIHRITRETIYDAAADRVRYLELRFTPVALSRAESFPLADVMDWVLDACESASDEFGIQTRLIASVNRQESVQVAEEVIRLAAERRERGILGVDLAGNEADFNGLNFAAVFREAREAGLHITIHAGEWGGPENVKAAIVNLGAERIGHGVRVVEDPRILMLARERGAVFEVCVTSNYQSGVIPSLTVHPASRMLNLGLQVTFNTDDPSISQITLSDEYRLACEDLGIPLEILKGRILGAAQASFLPEAEKAQLIKRLEVELQE